MKKTASFASFTLGALALALALGSPEAKACAQGTNCQAVVTQFTTIKTQLDNRYIVSLAGAALLSGTPTGSFAATPAAGIPAGTPLTPAAAYAGLPGQGVSVVGLTSIPCATTISVASNIYPAGAANYGATTNLNCATPTAANPVFYGTYGSATASASSVAGQAATKATAAAAAGTAIQAIAKP